MTKKRKSPRWYVVAQVYSRAVAIFGPFYSKAIAQGSCNLNSDFYRINKFIRFEVDTHTNLTRVFEDSFDSLLREPKSRYTAKDLGIEHKPRNGKAVSGDFATSQIVD